MTFSDIINRLTDSLGKVKHITAFVKEETLELVILCLIVGFASASFVVLCMIMIQRTILIKQNKVRKRLIEKYEIFLAESITYFYENNKFFGKKQFQVTLDKDDKTLPFHRKVLLEQILLMRKHVGGEESEVLYHIYRKLNFHKDSLKKLKSLYWDTRLQGMQELIAMETESLDKLFHIMTRDKHPFVRIAAIRALILQDSIWQPSLIRYSYSLSPWEQFEICDALSRRQNIQLPDFTPMLKSVNPTVVLFALRMIKHFHCMEAVPQVEPFLKSENHNVVKAAEEVMVQFGFDFEIFESEINTKESEIALINSDENNFNEPIITDEDIEIESLIDLYTFEIESLEPRYSYSRNIEINSSKYAYQSQSELIGMDILDDFLANY